jgi:hypothetical protein
MMGLFKCTSFVQDLELDLDNCVYSVDVYLNVDADVGKWVDGAGKTWYNVELRGFEVIECCIPTLSDLRLHSAHDSFAGLKEQAEKYIADHPERLTGGILNDYLGENP